MSNFLYRSKDASRLETIACGLSYNNTKAEAAIKHTLNEIAMRLETGWYEKQNDEHFFHEDVVENQRRIV